MKRNFVHQQGVKLLAIGLLISLSLTLFSHGQGSTQPRRLRDYDLPGLDEKVFLDTLVPWDVVQLIEFLAHKGGLKNIVIGNGVAGLTTKLKLQDITVGDALEVVLSVSGLAYEVKDDVVTIMTDAEYATFHGTSFRDTKQVKMVSLKYADALHVAGMLQAVKSGIGTVVGDAVTGTLILIDTPPKLEEMQTIIRHADVNTIGRILPTETQLFRLQYADVDEIRSEVESLLTERAGSVRVDRRTRSLIVTDLAYNMDKISGLIEAFDERPRQVFIEAKIVEVTLDDRFSMGMNWSQFFDGLNPRFAIEAVSKPGAVADPAAMFKYNTIVAGEDLSVVLEALKELADTKI
ncbi:MAG: hypothetical protein HQ559_15010, partial [Lentisphaerae bacterium]|nr:hypothetical protein [Lentisphaerota bacterium]